MAYVPDELVYDLSSPLVREVSLGDFTLRSEMDLVHDTSPAYGAAGLTSLDFQGAGFTNSFPGEGARAFSDSEMRDLHEMFNLWTSDGINAARTMDNFNRFYALYPELELPGNLKTYVFITRPDCNIFSNISDGILTEDAKTDGMTQRLLLSNPEILMMLSKDLTWQHDFIPYLQGRTLSMQIPDVQIRTSDFTVPFFSYKYSFPTVMNESETGGSFDITFREDGEFRVTKMFNYWINYMDAINKNRYKPSRSHILDNSFDYMCSVYEFICDPTSEWILFYAKYTGCVPVSVPTSNMSFSLGDSYDNKVPISFQYIRTECMKPGIITDFMRNVHRRSGVYCDLRDDDFDVTSPSLVACPTIVQSSAESGNKLLLKWYPRDMQGAIQRHNSAMPALSIMGQSSIPTPEEILNTRQVNEHLLEQSPLSKYLQTDSSLPR